jgi:DNA-binding MurR/RpiR family transcriptional regulator
MDKELNTSLSLADEIIRKWTSSQASLISFLLSGLTQQEIALETGSTQPTILRKVKSLGWQGISDLLIRYDEIIQI